MAELFSLAQRAKDFTKKHSELLCKAEELGHRIAETNTAYGTLYNADSPLFSLPAEVTSSIFLYAIIQDDVDVRSQRKFGDDSDDEDITGLEFELQCMGHGRNSALLMEVVVSHVCTNWRSVALNTTTLWTKFHYHPYDGHALDSSINRLDAYLERSGCRLLDLKFDFRDVVGNSDDCGERLDMLSKILPHTTRWWRVSILTDIITPFRDILNEVKPSPAPNLEHITLRGDCSYRSTGTSIELLLFKAGAFKLSSVTTDYSSIARLPPFSHLTNLRIERPQDIGGQKMSPECFLSILLMPNLTNLSLVRHDSPPIRTENLHTIHMPKLKYLRFTQHMNMCAAFPYLRAPVLETLIICDCLPLALPTDDYFFPSLRTLVFSNSRTDFNLTPLSKLTRRVTHLTFSVSSSLYFAYLFRGHGNYWPDLQVACLNVLCSDEVGDYVAFIFARINTDKPRLILQISKNLVDSWRIEVPDGLKEIEEACFVEAMTDENMLVLLHHPHGPLAS